MCTYKARGKIPKCKKLYEKSLPTTDELIDVQINRSPSQIAIIYKELNTEEYKDMVPLLKWNNKVFVWLIDQLPGINMTMAMPTTQNLSSKSLGGLHLTIEMK